MTRLSMRSVRSCLITGFVVVQFLIVLAACGGAAPTGSSALSASTAPVDSVTNVSGAAGATALPAVTSEAAEDIARPSNAGGPGEAATMAGEPKAGAVVFATYCKECHGDQGKGGVQNPGSDDGTVPPLNPIDETLVSKDPKMFAYNIDLFVQNGSTPEGDHPKVRMADWGKAGALTQQQIADVIAYIMSLNPAK